MRYLLIILFAVSAFATEDEAAKLVETSKARRETWKTFREKVSAGDICQPRDYTCFYGALGKIPGIHPEDLIAARSVLETFYLRSINDKTLPCTETCQHNMRALNVDLYLAIYGAYIAGQNSVYNFSDSTTVRATRLRAIMDLSAFGNTRKHLTYLKAEFAKIDFNKITQKHLKKNNYEKSFQKIESGQLFSKSVLCHLHPGSLVYDDIVNGKSKVDKKYSVWMKEFDETARKSCQDTKPIEFRGMDYSTREYYDQQTVKKLQAIKCEIRNYACLRKEFRNFSIHYAKDIERVFEYVFEFQKKSSTNPCDEICKAQGLLRATQTLITFLSQYDRQKLASTMDWSKYPEEKFRSITEDVSMLETMETTFGSVLTMMGNLDYKQVKNPGLKSELNSIAKDVSDFVSGKMFRDSVICTMEPWTAAYDKYMTPYKKPARNKKFEQGFIHFKQKVCK